MRQLVILACFSVVLGASTTQAQNVAPLWGYRPCPPAVVQPGCQPCQPGSPYYPPGTVPTIPHDPSMPPTIPNTDPTTPQVNPQPDAAPQVSDPFAQPTEAGGQSSRTFNMNFDGDFGGVFYTRTVVTTTTVPRVVGFTDRVVGTTQTVTVDQMGNKIVTNTPIVVQDPIIVEEQVQQRQVYRNILATRYQGIMVTDNDNPRPTDRVYFGYNFYSDAGTSLNPGLGNTDVQRQMVGFEKTFLNGDASFGMRLPFVQQYGPGVDSNNVGDLTLLGKYAWVNNRTTGDVVSTGFALTTPTGGGGALLLDGVEAPHSWLFQPWAGFIKVMDRAYFMGISNLVVPSSSLDPTLWGNSLAVGYWCYRNSGDRILTGIVPAAEMHVRTPLNHRDINDLVYLQDQVNVTGTVHFRMKRGILSPAVAVPLVGPRPFQVEAMCYANLVF